MLSFGLRIVVMIAGIHISQEIFAIDILIALKPSLEHDRKHVLRLLRLYGDQALLNEDLHKLKLLTNFDANLTSFL